MGYYDTPGESYDLFVSRSYDYIADHFTGLQIYKNLLTGAEEGSEKLNKTKIYKIYPNPIMNTTKIKYGLNNDFRVTLIIYNKAGQKVMTLVDKKQKAGYYIVLWNGNSNLRKKVPAEIYFCYLKAGDSKDTKKMIFIR